MSNFKINRRNFTFVCSETEGRRQSDALVKVTKTVYRLKPRGNRR